MTCAKPPERGFRYVLLSRLFKTQIYCLETKYFQLLNVTVTVQGCVFELL